MPLSSGAHGWSLAYLNRTPRKKRSPRDDYDTVEIPHSHKKYKRRTTLEEDALPIGSFWPIERRKPQVHPANQHQPDLHLFNSPQSRWGDTCNDSIANTHPSNSFMDSGRISPRIQSYDGQTQSTNSVPSVQRRAPPSGRRKLVYPVSKFKKVKSFEKHDALLPSIPQKQPEPVADNKVRLSPVSSATNSDNKSNSNTQNPNVVAHHIANNIAKDDDNAGEIEIITEGTLTPVSERKEESENYEKYNKKSISNEARSCEDSGTGSASDVSVTSPNIVPVMPPRYPQPESESSRTPSPASSHHDPLRQEIDLDSNKGSLENVSIPTDELLEIDDTEPEQLVAVNDSNGDYPQNSISDNSQNNYNSAIKSDKSNEKRNLKENTSKTSDSQTIREQKQKPPKITITKIEENDTQGKKITKNEDQPSHKKSRVIVVKPLSQNKSVDNRAKNNHNSTENKNPKAELLKTNQTVISVKEHNSNNSKVRIMS